MRGALDLGSVAPLLRLAPESRLRVRLRVLLLARSGTNQRLDSAPWFDVGTGIAIATGCPSPCATVWAIIPRSASAGRG
jgi:hypothetical protein